MVSFDPETIERWRRMGPETTHREARDALFQQGASASEDFIDVFEDLVERGLITWDEIERFESR